MMIVKVEIKKSEVWDIDDENISQFDALVESVQIVPLLPFITSYTFFPLTI